MTICFSLMPFVAPSLAVNFIQPRIPRTLVFFESIDRKPMNFAEYLKRKVKASNTYKSNWQGRDASEVTLRRNTMGNKPNSSTHHGPIPDSCTTTSIACQPSQAPGSGYSTDFSMDIVSNKKAGCTNCEDPVWGTSGGVTLRTCDEVTLLLTPPSNPVKGTNLTIPSTNILITPDCYCADNTVLPNNRGVVVASDQRNSATISGQYTGWRNQVAAPVNGMKPRQVVPFPSS